MLLSRTPDKDPLVDRVMRSHGAIRVNRAEDDAHFQGGRWTVGDEPPHHALCCAVRQGGRYLGLIELADPPGGRAFKLGEANALEYICEQFAEFIANRPVVIDPDVVLGSRA
jgi:GAF domain-containing protein